MIIVYSCKVCHLSTIQNNSATTLEKSTSFPLWHQQQNNYPAILNLTCIAAFRSSVSRLISLLACEEFCEWKWVWPRVLRACYLQLSPVLIKIKVPMDTKMVVVFNTRLWLAYLPLPLKFIKKKWMQLALGRYESESHLDPHCHCLVYFFHRFLVLSLHLI